MDWVQPTILWLQTSPYRGAGLLGAAIVLALLVDQLIKHVAIPIAHRTPTGFDEAFFGLIRQPVVVSIVLVGVWRAITSLPIAEFPHRVLSAIIATLAVAVWARTASRGARGFLQWSALRGQNAIVQQRTLPLLEILTKLMVVLGTAYFLLLAWHIDVSAWLASAGIVGVALGFAAQDTVANLFAGVAIIADAPYRVGDFLQLEDGTQGRVTDIGVRSTRILTLDNIEIVVPNSTMASGRIKNCSGGPYEKMRLQIPVGVAYGTDPATVERILLAVAAACPMVVHDDPDNRPAARFIEMADSSLNWKLLVWIAKPDQQAAVIDALNRAIYSSLNAEGVEIPFPQRDIHVKELPRSA